jgi:hypothetical protein
VEAVSGNNTDVRDFLVTRRARITPQQAGLQFYGGNRRVPGLPAPLRRQALPPPGRRRP